MPNWINNHWRIEAPPDVIDEIDALLFDYNDDGKRVKMRFQRVIPMPDILRRTVARFGQGGPWVRDNADDYDDHGRLATPEEAAEIKATGFENWYDWATKTWGAKWEIGDAFDIKEDGGGYLTLSFQSAWSPPVGVVEELRRRYEHLDGTDDEVNISASYEDDY